MNIILWILQIVLGLFFLVTGLIHWIIPPGLPPMMAWMYDMAPAMHWVSGTAEILGGIGLILPGIFRIQTRLTVLAAEGLFLIMIGAIIYHISRGEVQNIVQNIILAALLAFVVYGRMRLSPLKDRKAA